MKHYNCIQLIYFWKRNTHVQYRMCHTHRSHIHAVKVHCPDHPYVSNPPLCSMASFKHHKVQLLMNVCVLISCLLERRAALCGAHSGVSSDLYLPRTASGPRLICTSHGCHGSPWETPLLKCELTNKSDFRQSFSAAHLVEKVGQWLQSKAGGVLPALSRWGRKRRLFLDEKPLVSIDAFSPSGNCAEQESDKTVTWCTWWNKFKIIVGELNFPFFPFRSLNEKSTL